MSGALGKDRNSDSLERHQLACCRLLGEPAAPRGNGHMCDGKRITFKPSAATGYTVCIFRARH